MQSLSSERKNENVWIGLFFFPSPRLLRRRTPPTSIILSFAAVTAAAVLGENAFKSFSRWIESSRLCAIYDDTAQRRLTICLNSVVRPTYTPQRPCRVIKTGQARWAKYARAPVIRYNTARNNKRRRYHSAGGDERYFRLIIGAITHSPGEFGRVLARR